MREVKQRFLDSHDELPERTPSFLLKFTKTVNIPPGSIRSSVITLLSATVGSGVLSLPYAAKQSGVISCVVLLMLGSVAAYLTIWQLITVTVETSNLSDPPKTYQELATRSGGPRFAAFVKWLMVANLFGTCVAYMVVIATLVPAALSVFLPGDLQHEWYMQRWFILLVICVVFETPLGLMKEMGALRYTSLIAIFCSIYLAIITVIEYFIMCDDNDPNAPQCFVASMKDENVILHDFGFQGVIATIPLVVYSFTCQPQVLPIYLELVRPSPTRMLRVARYAFVFCVLLYVTIAIFGFLTFVGETQGDFLLNDYKHHQEVLVGGFGLIVAVSLCIPMFVHAGRFNIIGRNNNNSNDNDNDNNDDDEESYMDGSVNGNSGEILYSQMQQEQQQQNMHKLTTTSSSQQEDVEDSNTCGGKCTRCLNKGDTYHRLVTLVWIFSAYGVASTFKNIEFVISILGSTTIPIIGYILPAFFLIRLTPRNSYKCMKAVCCTMALVVEVICLSNLGFQIKSWAKGDI